MSGVASRRAYRPLIAELVFAGLAGTVVNSSVTVAVAAIAEDFDASVSDVAVVVVLLNVSMAFLMPLTGLAVRAFGSRRVLMAAGALVAASSLLLSLSPGLPTLGLARVLQGAGLAAVVPTSVQVTTQLLDDVDRGRALGWWAASNGLGLAFAPLIGGLLVDLAGWRWVTIPSILLGVGLVVTARLGIPRDLQHDPGVPTGTVLALGLMTGTLMSALAALSAEGWAAAAVLALVFVLAVTLAWVTRSRTAVLVVGWYRDRGVRRTSLGAGLQMVANGMVQITVPAWLITTGILTGGPAGAVLMAMTLTMAAMGLLTGRASGVPFVRWLRRGLLGCAVGLAGVAAATVGTWWIVVPFLVVLGLGAGSLLSPSLTGFSHTAAGANAIGLSVFNVLRLSSFAVGALIGATALDVGRPGLAFGILSVVCAVSWLATLAGRARA